MSTVAVGPISRPQAALRTVLGAMPSVWDFLRVASELEALALIFEVEAPGGPNVPSILIDHEPGFAMERAGMGPAGFTDTAGGLMVIFRGVIETTDSAIERQRKFTNELGTILHELIQNTTGGAQGVIVQRCVMTTAAMETHPEEAASIEPHMRCDVRMVFTMQTEPNVAGA